jgi:type IV pilus assembly protein PilC
MANYSFVAINPDGLETRGTLDVGDQIEALRRIKEMGLYPTRVLAEPKRGRAAAAAAAQGRRKGGPHIAVRRRRIWPWPGGGVKVRVLTVFTRQLATLVQAGMPLLRSLRTLQEQEGNPTLRRVLGELAAAIEGGSSLTEAVAMHPKVFNRLYVNMVKAGEASGALDLTLARLAEFMEKAQKIKGRIQAAMFYPCAVMVVATGIVLLLMLFVLPRFQQIFDGLLEGARMPAFTLLMLHISGVIRHHFPAACVGAGFLGVGVGLALRTRWGRWLWDKTKLSLPALGPVFRKAAISRFARTLGTLTGSGVPILQGLTIVKETAGNVVVANVVARLHEHVKEGDPLAPTLKTSGVFPAMVAGMVDVGEQTGSLPEMLGKIADNCDEEVDNAAGAMTSLLEPIMIVFLAIVVGSIVIAMFLPLLRVIDLSSGDMTQRKGDGI